MLGRRGQGVEMKTSEEERNEIVFLFDALSGCCDLRYQW